MKEHDLINYIVSKPNSKEYFQEIYSCKKYFSEYGKKLLDCFKKNIENSENLDINILNTLPKDYQNLVMSSESQLLKEPFEMLTELKKEYVKNSVKNIEKSNSVEEIEKQLDELKGIFSKTRIVEKLSLEKMGYKFFENIDKQKIEKQIKTKNWFKFNKNIKLYKGDVIVIAGRPGSGKTAMALSLALELAKNGAKGLFFSLEMGEEQIINRIMSQISGVSLSKLQDSKEFETLKNEEHERLQRAFKELLELKDNLQIISGNFSSDEILEQVELENPEFVIIDYMQLLRSKEGRGRVEEITYLSMELKRIAMKCKIPVIELCQLSRAVEQRGNRRPQLSDLRESGQIEQDASCVIGIYRDSYYNEEADPNEMESIILKNRNGITGTIYFNFLGAIQKVYERF